MMNVFSGITSRKLFFLLEEKSSDFIVKYVFISVSVSSSACLLYFCLSYSLSVPFFLLHFVRRAYQQELGDFN